MAANVRASGRLWGRDRRRAGSSADKHGRGQKSARCRCRSGGEVTPQRDTRGKPCAARRRAGPGAAFGVKPPPHLCTDAKHRIQPCIKEKASLVTKGGKRKKKKIGMPEKDETPTATRSNHNRVERRTLPKRGLQACLPFSSSRRFLLYHVFWQSQQK